MKNIFSIILNLFLLFLIVSCEKPLEIEEVKIPIDSLYFSCKLDGELVTLKSPSTTSYSEGGSFQRLHKLKDSPKDSAIVGYQKSFQNDSIRVTIGFIRSVLVDTTYLFILNNYDQNFKTQIFATGTYRYLYDDPQWGYIKTSPQNEGFYIEISDLIKSVTYTSHLNYITDLSKSKYDEFLRNTSCQITKSTALDSGIYSDYHNAWFIESTFDCKLYENTIDSNKSINLSEGHFNGIF